MFLLIRFIVENYCTLYKCNDDVMKGLTFLKLEHSLFEFVDVVVGLLQLFFHLLLVPATTNPSTPTQYATRHAQQRTPTRTRRDFIRKKYAI